MREGHQKVQSQDGKDGYVPLNEGYIPITKKGYTPQGDPKAPLPAGPKGGSGVVPATPTQKRT